MKWFWLSFFSLVSLALAHCAPPGSPMDIGGAEAGNPPAPSAREVVGVLEAEEADGEENEEADGEEGDGEETKQADLDDCPADTVIAIDSGDAEIIDEILNDCSFDVSLPVEDAYTIQFEEEGEHVGTVYFQPDPAQFPTTYLYVEEGDDPIDLGMITLSYDAMALPEIEPALQSDLDGDGINDYEDFDDDNNGVDDKDEMDCDLDGLWDFIDPDLSTCNGDDAGETTGDGGSEEEGETPVEDSGSDDGATNEPVSTEPVTPAEPEPTEPVYSAYVLEVIPRKDAGMQEGDYGVPLDRMVSARLDCRAKPASVDSETFKITDSSDNQIACRYDFADDNHVVTCRHSFDKFLPVTVYTATFDGVVCLDGRAIEPRSWSWKTTRAKSAGGF